MSGIVERLRNAADYAYDAIDAERLEEAASTITALEERVRVLEGNLAEAYERAARVADKAAEPKDCDRASYDYSCNFWECSMERNGKDCLCYERTDEAEAIAKAIRALNASQSPVSEESTTQQPGDKT